MKEQASFTGEARNSTLINTSEDDIK